MKLANSPQVAICQVFFAHGISILDLHFDSGGKSIFAKYR